MIGKKCKCIAPFLSIVFEACFPCDEGFVYKKKSGKRMSEIDGLDILATPC